MATLIDRGQVRWARTLAHEFGPRSAAVSDDGSVLLLDEWINILSPHAIMVLAPDGRTITEHDARAAIALLDVPAAEVTRLARVGAWRSSEPIIEGSAAIVEAGGKMLRISLRDGSLSLRR